MALVPFQSPHAPSAVQSVESVVRTLEEDFRTSVWGDFAGGGGGWGVCTRGMPGEGEVRRRRPRRVGVCECGAEVVKYDGEEKSESEESWG